MIMIYCMLLKQIATLLDQYFVLVQNLHRITHFYHHTAQFYLCVLLDYVVYMPKYSINYCTFVTFVHFHLSQSVVTLQIVSACREQMSNK